MRGESQRQIAFKAALPKVVHVWNLLVHQALWFGSLWKMKLVPQEDGRHAQYPDGSVIGESQITVNPICDLPILQPQRGPFQVCLLCPLPRVLKRSGSTRTLKADFHGRHSCLSALTISVHPRPWEPLHNFQGPPAQVKATLEILRVLLL